ncbi:MAG TPA: septum formation initiator family protein [Promineifilum sp.]|nr:septum formation initiator family protein [Promineifilum sp.]
MMATPEEKRRPRQARELARRLGLLTQAQAATGWAVILILGALLGVIYLNQASKIAAIGRHVQRVQADLDEVKRTNAELERQIAEAQALDRLEAEARRLGFVPAAPGDIEYIVIPNYPTEPAVERVEPTGPLEQPEPPASMWEAIVLAVRDLGIDLTRGEANEQ